MLLRTSRTDTPLPATRAARPRPWVFWAVFVGIWTAFGVMIAAPRVLLVGGQTQPAHWGGELRFAIFDMYSWALVALCARWLADRVSLERGRWVRAAVIHLGGALVIISLRFWLTNGLATLVGWIPVLPTPAMFIAVLPWNLLFYFPTLGVWYALEYYGRYRAREVEASQLELDASRLELKAALLQTRLVEAELQSLKAQLQPHFLFNTLNTIASLVHDDPEQAEQMIVCLSDLLRNTLAHRWQQEVSLREEIDLIAPYLEIEQTRLGERLTTRISLSPATLDARIPHLILQPLVENSIRHGIAPRRAPGRIEITSRRENGRLRVRIRDDGIGLREKASPDPGGGVGLSNVRQRLEQLYGPRHHLRVENHPDGGVLVDISIPFRVKRD